MSIEDGSRSATPRAGSERPAAADRPRTGRGPRAGRLLRRATAVVVGLGLALLAAELLVRATATEFDVHHVWWPNTRKSLRPSPGVLPGVEGEARFVVNSIGLRGDELVPEHDYRILAIGGSTTECLYLDQDKAWPQVVQRLLNEGQRQRRVWVGNAGRAGLNLRHHVVQLRRLLPELDGIDLVIVLVGVNDLTLRLAEGADYDPDYMQRPDADRTLARRAFQLLPRDREDRLPFPKNAALWRTASRLWKTWFPRAEQDDEAHAYEVWRERRRSAPRLLDELPDLSSSLAEYRRNLGTLIETARRHGVRVVLSTQPHVWRPDLPEATKRLLWYGGDGNFFEESGLDYYTVPALQRAMRAYNEVLVELAREVGAECVDLAALLHDDLDLFYDDVHFNVLGAARVATILAEYLLDRPPFDVAKSEGR